MSAEKITVADLGVAFPGGLSAEELANTICQAEQDGFRSCWISEDYYYGGAMATAGYIAALTRRIGIGIGVVNPYTRNSEIIAMESAVVDAASKGRFELAIGSSNRRWIETQMCIPFEKPKTRLFESIQAVRSLMKGETLDTDGRTISAHDVALSFRPYRPDMPVLAGVTGEKSLQDAGRYADGALLSIMCSVPYAKWARKVVDDAAREAGRTEHLPIYAYVPLYLGDPADGCKTFAETVGYFVSRMAQRPFIQQSCPPADITALTECSRNGKNPADFVTPEIAAHYTVIGNAAVCRARLQEYYDAGVDQVILCACGDISAARMMDFAKEILNKNTL